MSAPVDLQRVIGAVMQEHPDALPHGGRQREVLSHLRACRTAALGGQRHRCPRCRYERVRYHSCRDRHCPKCQGGASARWAERQSEQLLAVSYHHVVFTVPSALNPWVGRYPRVLYSQLFASAWATLSAFAMRHKRLGGQPGMSAVLHTWGQTLTRHVHLHCLVPGGVLTEAGAWRSVTGTYLFPVRALSRRFRGHFVAGLRARAGELPRLRPEDIDRMLEQLMATEWIVYTKACLTHTHRVVDYLARYTHRIALSDARLLAMRDDRVCLRYIDYRDGGARKTLWLEATELVRRFALHVLPKGFKRVRHFGFLANRCRVERLRTIRAAIARERATAEPLTGCGAAASSACVPTEPCPRCGVGVLHLLLAFPPARLDTG